MIDPADHGSEIKIPRRNGSDTVSPSHSPIKIKESSLDFGVNYFSRLGNRVRALDLCHAEYSRIRKDLINVCAIDR
jgi:hypothetical protein